MQKTRSFQQYLSLASLCSLGLAAAPVLSGCGGGSGSAISQAGTTFGSSVSVGTGSARTFVNHDNFGNPTAIGVKISEAALASLPADDASFVLPLPSNDNTAPVNHIELDWEAHGHPPDPIYTNPHFDVHFYTVSQTERDAIQPPNGDTPAPAAKYVAPNYVSGVDTVPRMGVHYIDPTAPEFNPPQPFSRTFIYGFYKGNQVFFEPMIAKSYLDTKPNESIAIKQPSAFQKTGYYPTRYTVKYDASAKEYTIALEGLTQRQAS
jgi:hypothetical protein